MAVENFDIPQHVSLIGAGNCGCAFAADLASRGKSVMLYGHPDHPGAIPMIEKSGGWLNSSGDVIGRYAIKTTSDIGQALHYSPFIVIAVPSYGQSAVLEELGPFDLRNHVLVVNVGNFFFLSATRITNAKAVVETDISPYATRIVGDTVVVKGTKRQLAIWAAPPAHVEPALKRQVQSIFSPQLNWCKSLIQVGLNNINPIAHAPAMLLNTGWIESTKGDFYFYADGMSPSVSRVTEQMDEERRAIGRAYGIELASIVDYMNHNYQHRKEFPNYYEFARGSAVHNKTKSSPQSMKHRYLLEDIRYCVVPWYELGLKAGLASPTINAIISLASIISGFDYLATTRGVNAIGLTEASKEEIAQALGGSLDDATCVLAPPAEAQPKIANTPVQKVAA